MLFVGGTQDNDPRNNTNITKLFLFVRVISWIVFRQSSSGVENESLNCQSHTVFVIRACRMKALDLM